MSPSRCALRTMAWRPVDLRVFGFVQSPSPDRPPQFQTFCNGQPFLNRCLTERGRERPSVSRRHFSPSLLPWFCFDRRLYGPAMMFSRLVSFSPGAELLSRCRSFGGSPRSYSAGMSQPERLLKKLWLCAPAPAEASVTPRPESQSFARARRRQSVYLLPI